MPDLISSALAVRFDRNDPVAASEAAQWALSELHSALGERRSGGNGITLIVGGPGSSDLTDAAAAAGLKLPEQGESLALFCSGGNLYAYGADSRGLVYALTELADRVRYSADGLIGGDLPLVETPKSGIRSVARLFSSYEEDMAWFHDRGFWRSYLTMLATNRFNRFSLTLGLAYNYPYHNANITDVYLHFPYPYLFDLPGYDIKVVELAAEERAANLEMLKFIGAEAAKRGLEFQLGLWTQRYDFDDVPRANFTVEGATADNITPYCRDAVIALLTEVPEITGLTFRIHVEGGIAEGDYPFWDSMFSGIASVGRPIEIDMHCKGLDFKTIDLARQTGMPMAVSPKYCGEHIGLPYHQSAIRDKEYPPEAPRSNREQLSQGSRKFLRYSYGDLLRKGRDYKVLFRVWPGTQRLLLWGDPAFAAGYAEGGRFCNSDGIEWFDPQSFKGRQGKGVAGQRFNYAQQGLATRYDWQKYAYQYRLLGRLAYSPEAKPESWQRFLAHECGDAAAHCEAALSKASRIMPLITIAHGPSASNNYYWPEMYTNMSLAPNANPRPYARDILGEARFGTVPSFDPQLFATPVEYAKLLVEGQTGSRYTPLDVADWLETLARETEEALGAAGTTASFEQPGVQRMVIDARIAAGLGLFFAEKFRAACWLELFLLTRATAAYEQALSYLRRAILAYRTAASASEGAYVDDLTYGPQAWLRGSWHKKLPEFENEILEVEAMRTEGAFNNKPEAAALAAIAALSARLPTRSGGINVEAATTFTAGGAFPVSAGVPEAGDAEVTLHYRHVNQAERWSLIRMERSGDRFAAAVPADYLESDFHLQYYVSVVGKGKTRLAPGLDASLANQPYRVALQV